MTRPVARHLALLVLLAACGGGSVATGGPDGAPGGGLDAAGAGPSDASHGAGPDAGGAARPDAGGGSVLPTGTPAADEVRINETKAFQTMDGIGAAAYNFPYGNDIGWSWSSVSYVFDELQLRYVRTAPWFGFWEESNDNADPATANWDALGTNGITASHDVGFAQYLTGKGIEVMPGFWNVGDWLASGSPRAVAPGMYPELGETIATYVANLVNHSVPQPFLEVQNEPDIEAGIRYPSPQALRDAALAVLDQLDRHGLSGAKLHGPNLCSPSNVADWARVWLADARLRERTSAVSYHTWWSDSFQEYDAIRQVAEENGKPVWATEVGYCALTDGCFGGTHYLRPETWATAWDYAMSHYRAIAWSRASRSYHWTVLGHDAVVSGTGQRLPSFYALKHFSAFIPPGARHLESASGDPEVLALAFLLPNGERSLVLLNTGAASKTIRLTSVRGSALSAHDGIASTNGSYAVAQTAQGPNGSGQVVVTLRPQSINSMFLAGP